MILDYYQLREQPFGVTPDSRFLYSSATHKEALASLLYAIESGRGFAALIAKPGMGKTTLIYEALRRLQGRARTVFLFQTVATPVEFLSALLADLGVSTVPGTLVELQAKLNQVLEEQARLGKPLVVFIDEAQNLDNAVLEMVRMLSNFETSQEKLMQIVLSGQPQLAERLQGADLVQLRQRISILCRLAPLSAEDVARYIRHRLRAAGYSDEKPLFTKAAAALIAEKSEGIPRNINNLCFHALSLGSVLKRKPIDEDILREVVADLDLEPLAAEKAGAVAKPRPQPTQAEAKRLPQLAWAGIAAVILAALLVWIGVRFGSHHSSPEVAAAPITRPQASPRISLHSVPVEPAAKAAPAPASNSIQVTPGETLYRICMKHLGSYNSEVVAEVRKLNPWLTDPNHIRSGRAILIPARESARQSVAQAAAGRLAGTGGAQ